MMTRSPGMRVLAALATLSCLSVTVAQAHPPPFSVHDMDKDGYVSRQEFETFRAQRHAERAAEGRRLRNAPQMLQFEDIDLDHNKLIDEKEMLDAINRRRTLERRRPWSWPGSDAD